MHCFIDHPQNKIKIYLGVLNTWILNKIMHSNNIDSTEEDWKIKEKNLNLRFFLF